MKNYLLLSVIVIAFVVTGCSSASKSTGVWVNDEKIQEKSFSNVFIVVMTADMEARTKLENDLAAAAVAKGYKATKSLELMKPTLNSQVPAKEEIVNIVKQTSCDAVFVATLLKKEEDIRYTPGTTAYTMRPYYSWGGTYPGYYRRWYPAIYTPGYYEKEKNYFMQSNLYEVASEELMWSVQSEVYNPSSISNFSKKYTSVLVKQLEKANLLKK